MNRMTNRTRILAQLVAALHVATSTLGYAATTDLSNNPLANVSGTAAVKPNIMFLLDDSGSMMQQYTPDYVSERWGAPATSDMHCRNSLDTTVRITPGSTITDSNANRDLCVLGDPPYMSADFNKQYYNPEISYTPPIDYLGSSYTNQTSANTTGWTSVLTDGFNQQNLNQLEGAATSVDLTLAVPSRKWCNDAAGTTCVNNTGDYAFPEGAGGTYRYNYDGGANNNRYDFGPPYYFSIAAAEYCSDASLNNCTYLQKGATPPAGWFPAKVRWCNSATEANRTYNIAGPGPNNNQPNTGTCRAKKSGAFQYARFATFAQSATPYGTIKIDNSGSTDSVSISDVKVGAVVITNAAVVAPGGTSTPGDRAALATLLAASINTRISAPEYLACAGAACLGPIGVSLPTDTVAVYPAVAAASYPPMTVTAPSTHITRPYGVITVGHSGSGGSKTTSITVNGVEIQNGGLANFGNNSTANRTAAANAIAARINTYLNTTPWEYTAATNVAGTNCNAANKICVYPPAPPSAPGAIANGYAFNITTSGGGGISLTSLKFAGGVSRFIPTNITSIGSVSAFARVDIAPGSVYPRGANRSDCIADASSCTYEEEMTNYANWYAYYRTRMQMMKTSVGQAFLPLNTDYRLGFTTINNTTFSGTSGTRWLALADLDSTQKQTWYTKLYAQTPSGSTPLRSALDRMGKLYEGTLSGAPDPVEYSCQQNFTILTTDGYWNQSFTGYGDQDNVDSGGNAQSAPFCNRNIGCYDGNLGGGSANSLADVAMYYYKRDLRPSMDNNVPTSTNDPNPAQHMTTFTIGLGVDGVMTFQEGYATAASGDFYKIKTGATASASDCSWQTAGTVCNWPVPAADTETAVDDLWHAAVNGHGSYFSAKDPESMARGLADALTNLKVRNAAASASATSTPNVTQDDNDIFSATFRTVKWDGELVAQKIDTATGNLLPTVTWEAQALLDDKVQNTSDSRTLYTMDAATATPTRKAFTWADLTAAERAYFDNKCTGASQMSQCASLSAAERAQANNGQKMVEYLRGRKEMEITVPPLYRDREHVLGDIASAKPAYVRNPRRNYGDIGYAAFKSAQATRQAMVYVAANDGMMHALNASTGEELWAYIPRMIYPELYKLADTNYQNNHRYYVDGSPEAGDVYINGAWRTILVGGLNKGGRGYYALDITDPTDPVILWEFCADAALCNLADADLGYTYGNPIITKRQSDGKWVVVFTSGYNNVSPGDGKGYFYVVDAADGTLLNKVSTLVGDTTTPSGLARITGLAQNAQTDNTVETVYGGDLLGNLWRLDMATATVTQLAAVTDYLGVAQPITSRPELGKCDNTIMVFAGTGRYLGVSDLTNTQRQSMYGVKDSTATYGVFRTTSAVQQSFSPLGGGGYTVSNNPVDLAATPGWYVDFDQNSGERVNLDPALIFGNLLVITNQPSDITACTTGGSSYKYEFNYCTGSYLLASPNQQVGTKLGNSIVVGFIVIRLPSGALKVVTTFAGGEKTTSGVTGSSSGKVRRVSWREITQ
ncbi:MAG: PQQ-binding-like beta-propeller repeat protein [Rhodocyclales bacterium]|nr:PQQ-binding-like beta-propeller repeat protein [Rhodocyclales bacterium]